MSEIKPSVVQWLRFFRWPNLAMVLLTMVLVRWAGMGPLLGAPGVWAVSHLSFAGMVLATMLIAAAGYVANDITDQGIDEINKPHRVFVGRFIGAEQASNLAGGLILAAAVSLLPIVREIGFYWWMLLYPASAGLLLGYAFSLKCVPVVGNTVVSVLSAIVPLLVLFAEQPALSASNYVPGSLLIAAFAVFALLASLFREVVKDLEDAAGDEIFGCQTLAVSAPLAARKLALVSAGTLLVAVMVFLMLWPLAGWSAWLTGAVAVAVPLIASLLRLRTAGAPGDYARVSVLAKLTMLGGLLLLPTLSGAL